MAAGARVVALRSDVLGWQLDREGWRGGSGDGTDGNVYDGTEAPA